MDMEKNQYINLNLNNLTLISSVSFNFYLPND